MQAALALLVTSGLLAAATARSTRWAGTLAVAGCAGAAVLAIGAALGPLLGGAVAAREFPLPLSGGTFVLGLDALSAFFVVLLMALAVPAALFGVGYPGGRGGRGRPGCAFCFFNLLVACLLTVVTARDALLFLLAWEGMTLTSYFLVAYHHESAAIRSAGLRYLAASQLAAACLLALFALLAADAASLRFDALATAGARAGAGPGAVVFVLAVLGFGTKAGLVPLHVWLPHAYPAAPSHVAALLSGFMTKTGFYGLLRVMAFLGPPTPAQGVVLVGLGGTSAVLGIAYSLGQKDLKRALAYSSIENMGIVAVGLGIGCLGVSMRSPVVATLAMTGALVHLLNHMVGKGLLFLAAGSVQHAAHSRNLEELGGLFRRAPWTGTAFLAGAASVAALPPMGGLLGEWLIVSAGLLAVGNLPVVPAVVVLMGLLALALTGGLAVASMARLFSSVFLGRARSPHADACRAPSLMQTLPAAALALAGLALGLFPAVAMRIASGAADLIDGAFEPGAAPLAAPLAATSRIGLVALLLVAVAATLFLVRTRLGGAVVPRRVETWGCGYGKPNARMQYTGTSFGAPLVRALQGLLAPGVTGNPAKGLFPAPVSRETRVVDRCEEGFYLPLFLGIAARLARVRRSGRRTVNHQILAIVGVLLVCLLWAIASRWVHTP